MCRSAPTVPERSLLAIHSATRHTLRLVADLVASSQAQVQAERAGSLLWLRGTDLLSLLLEIDAAMTATERDEARAVLLDDELTGDALVSAAMAATSVGQLAARVRSRHIIELADQPERFRSRFQPIVDLDDGATIGHEALLRALDSSDRELPAAELFRAAEAGGWTTTLDRIGRETAIRDAAGWLGDDRLFINFIPTSIYRPEVCLATTLAAADRHGIDLRQIVFEVTETHRTEDVRHLTTVAEHYRSRGASIALDDVGSGYSSLTMVAQLRPEVVKLDMALVQALPDPTAVSIVRSVIQLSHDLGAAVVAEGIETDEQRRVSRDLGADWGQGWLFGRPALPPRGPAGDAAASHATASDATHHEVAATRR